MSKKALQIFNPRLFEQMTQYNILDTNSRNKKIDGFITLFEKEFIFEDENIYENKILKDLWMQLKIL